MTGTATSLCPSYVVHCQFLRRAVSKSRLSPILLGCLLLAILYRTREAEIGQKRSLSLFNKLGMTQKMKRVEQFLYRETVFIAFAQITQDRYLIRRQPLAEEAAQRQ